MDIKANLQEDTYLLRTRLDSASTQWTSLLQDTYYGPLVAQLRAQIVSIQLPHVAVPAKRNRRARKSFTV